PRIRLHLPRTVSRFDSQRAADLLIEQLARAQDGVVRYKALRGLGRLVVTGRVRVDRAIVEAEIRKNLSEHLRILALLVPLDRGIRAAPARAKASGRLVAGLLDDKLRQSLERAFRFLQIAHRNEDIRGVYSALRSRDKRTRANALEFLDALTAQAARK